MWRRLSWQQLVQATRMRRYSTVSANAEVILEQIGSVGLITLNRLKSMNAISLNILRAMQPAVLEWERSSSVQVIVIRSAGGKAFSAGGDMKASYGAAEQRTTEGELVFTEAYRMQYTVGTVRKPYVSLVDGVAMGGGLALAAHGHFCVATERAVVAMPETAIGLVPDAGCSQLLARLPGHLGAFLGLTGHRVRGADAAHVAIASHFVPSSALHALLDTLLASDCHHLQDLRHLLDRFCAPFARDRPAFSLQPLVAHIDAVYSADTVEEMFRRLERLAPLHPWAGEQLQQLQQMSPLSLKLAHRLLRYVKTLNLADVFQTEYRICGRRLVEHDFLAAIHALLVAKAGRPQWKPDSLEAVTDQMVDAYFQPLPPAKELRLDRSRLSDSNPRRIP